MTTPSPKIQNWQSQLSNLTDDFSKAFGQLTAQELNWKANSKMWSIAQVIEHIILVNESYFEAPEQIRAGKYKYPFIARFPYFPRLMGNMIYKSVLPETKRKQPTLPIWEPAQSEVAEDILAQFKAHQHALAAFMSDNQDLVANGTLVCSPANRLIVYTFERMFEIMLAHEQRHFNQALAVLEMRKD